MNKDQIHGKIDQAKGKIKQAVGEGLNDQKLANKGVVDQVKGAAEETWGNAKDAAAATADRHRDEADQQGNAARHKVVDKVNDVKDNLKEKLGAHKKEEEHKRTA
jgi:uncharacterized protein YjbJ (UPF0337 family)